MSIAATSARPRAGICTGAHLLALLAALALAAAPLAALGHHHAPTLAGNEDPDCSVCLWQAHQAADLVAPATVPGPGSGDLEPALTTPAAPTPALPGCAARAPPCFPA